MRILITGGKSEIGTVIAKHRLTKGDEVIVTSSSGLSGDFLEGKVQVLKFDLAAPTESESDLETELKKGLDAIILNAASKTPHLAKAHELDFIETEKFLQENINGNIWLLQKVLPYFVNNKFGRIIFMSSMNTQFPIPGYSVYAAAKSALETYVKYISVEYGEHNITANSIRLGVIQTQRNKAFWSRNSIREMLTSKTSLKRLGQPEELVPVVDALLEKNSYIQGTVIDVSGGLHIPR